MCQNRAAMKVGTDGCLLGALAEGGKRILDIGTGTGLLALMMAQRFADARVEAVEIDADAAADARANFSASPWHDRIRLSEGAFQNFRTARVGMVKFDSIVCNPPYFNSGPGCADESRCRARHSSGLTFGQLAEGVADLLAGNGVFSVVLPTDAYGQFVSECVKNGLWVKCRYDIRTVSHKPAKRTVLVLSHSQVGIPLHTAHSLRNADGTYSEWYCGLMDGFLLYVPKP